MNTAPDNRALIRSGIGVAALSALALSACGSDDDSPAAFEDAAATEEISESEPVEEPAETELPQAEPGFTYEDLSREITSTASEQPERNTVITPAGTLTIDEVQTLETVPADAVNLDPVYEEAEDDSVGEETQAAAGDPLDYAPADGEVFRVLDITFAPDQELDHDTSSALALNDGASQTHLRDLDTSFSLRMLVSAAEDDSNQLVVSSDGHDQFIDVLTGKRAGEDDEDVAAGYYREVTQQDLNHTFSIDLDPIETAHERGNDVDDIDLDVHVHASSIRLTAWTEEDGWANPGEVWVVADWELGVAREGSQRAVVEEVSLNFVVEAGDEPAEENFYQDSTRYLQDELTMHAAVPIETTEVELSSYGSAEVSLDTFSGNVSIVGSGNREYETDPLEVVFPDERYGSDSDEVEEAEEDSAEDDL